MPSKRSRSRPTKAKRPGQRKRQRSGLKTFALLSVMIVVAVAVVALIAVLDRARGGSPAQPAEVSLDKSEGAADAPVVVVEYADFQCPYCREFATGPERQLKEDYVDQGQVRFVYRHFAFIGDESIWAAEASECANEQGRFWDYHDRLFEEQSGENVGTFSRDNLKRFAADLGLDTQQFTQCLDSDQYRAKVRQEINEARQLRINSTPTILVNGRLIRNGSDYQMLKSAVEAALNSGG